MLHIEGDNTMWKNVFMLTAFMLLAGFIGSAQAGVKSLTVKVDGLACPFCAYGLEKKLKKVEGVETLNIDINAGEVVLSVVEGSRLTGASGTMVAQVQRAVEEGGFTARAFEARVEGKVVAQNGGETQLELSGTGESLVLEESASLEELRKFQGDWPVQVVGMLFPDTSPLRLRVEKVITSESAGTLRRLKIAGLACMGCVEAIQADLEKRDGIKNIELDLESGLAEILVEDERVSGESLAELVNTLGMEGMPAGTFTAIVLED